MKIFVVGIGPGGAAYRTPQAVEAIVQSDVVIGYHAYVALVRDLTIGKEVLSTAMKQEVARCELALEAALQGKTVAFVCSGDAGVYGMAGILLEMAAAHPAVTIEVVAGITAACSGAALLGAPLVHDFAVISLSDLLTSWETIEKRLALAAEADFVICLYNPKSQKRVTQLTRAVELIAMHRAADTPCGIVRQIGRVGESAKCCQLQELAAVEEIDMFTTVFIGNSQTMLLNGRMVTPRGYHGV